MSSTTTKALSAATGVAALAAGMGGMVVAAGPASATVATPSLSPSTCAAPSVTGYNSALNSAWVRTSQYRTLHAKSVKAKATWVKARGSAKTLAKKNMLKANAVELKAKRAWVAANSYFAYTGTASQDSLTAVAASGRDGLWKWGSYTTRILVKNGKLVAVCSGVEESAAGPVSGTDTRSDVDKANDVATSASLYQGTTSPVVPANPSNIAGTLPILWFAAKSGASHSVAVITEQVTTCATADYTTISALCPNGGLYAGGVSSASYTVEGFQKSLAATLLSAKTAGKLAA